MVLRKRSLSKSNRVGKEGDQVDSNPTDGVQKNTQESENGQNGPAFSAGEEVADWFNLLQRTVPQSVSTWSKAISMGLDDMSKVKGLKQILSFEYKGVNRLLDTFLAQQSGLMQLLFDSQLNFLGKVLKEFEQPEATSQPLAVGKDIISVLFKAQEDWMKITQSVIKSANPAP